MLIRKIALLSVVVSAFAGCSLMQPDSVSTPKVDLVGGAWVAEDIDGRGAVYEGKSTLTFANDRKVSGHGGCNQYGGTVELKGASLIVSQLASTKMACEPALMDQETRFMAALQAARSYKMSGDNKLILSDATGTPRLKFSR